jgi:hypothetical protein
MDDITRLKKQVKLLTIASTTLGILTMGLLVGVARLKSHEAWPDMTVGKLTVKEVRVVSPGGQPKMLLFTHDDDPALALVDEAANTRVLLTGTKAGWYLAFVGADKTKNLILTGGGLLVGDEAHANLRLVAPSDGGPRMQLRDENGYETIIGRTVLKEKQSGTQSITSAASIVASGQESIVHWPLLEPTVKPEVKSK